MSMPQKRLAVLIDADNSQPSIIEGLLDEIAAHGTASVKRIYGDWTEPQLKGWKKALVEHGIHPMQQFAYTSGKNATDSALIIDAMDLLYTKNFDGFCIVSSDSDFTRLASRIREAGLLVIGFGERKTPKAFMSACDKFVFTENLRRGESDKNGTVKKSAGADDKRLHALLLNAVEDLADESGWAYMGAIGQNIANKSPEFDPRTYGFRKLSDLMEKTGLLELRDDPFGKQQLQVRIKRQKRGYGK